MNVRFGNDWRRMFDFLSTTLLVYYIVFLPPGHAGLLMPVTSLMLKIVSSPNLISNGIYLFLFGMKTMGLLGIVLGYPGTGGKIACITGAIIFLSTKKITENLKRLNAHFLYLLWIAAVLYLSYLLGPQTSYSREKLIMTIFNGIVLLIGYYYLINSTSADWYHIGQLGVISALLCLGIWVVQYPEVRPFGLIDIGAMRIAMESNRDILELRNNVSGMALLGFVLIYSSSPDAFLSFLTRVSLYLYILAAFIIMSWSGARLPFIIAVTASILILFTRPRYLKRYVVISSLLIITSVFVVLYGVSRQIPFISMVTDKSLAVSYRLNRDINWAAGYRRFIEKPILGHGLGGYYIEGYSSPGEGTYAHNLFLELLSETGVFGTAILYIPVFLGKVRKTLSFKMRAENGAVVFPLLCFAFLQAMISFDLRTSIGLFSICGAIRSKIKYQHNRWTVERSNGY